MAEEENWVALAKISKISDGLTQFRKRRKKIAVVKRSGEIVQVFEDNCPHNRRILISKDFDMGDNTIVCNLHGACFSLDNGDVIRGPGREGLKLLDHRVVKDKLEVKLDL